MSGDLFLAFPPWLEAFLNGLIKRYITPDKITAALNDVVDKVVVQLKTFVDSTPAAWDNAILAAVEESLRECAANGDTDTICKLLGSGKAEFVRILRLLSANTKTTLDDTVVNIIAQSLGVP